MSNITSVSNIPNFDRQTYESLIKEAKSNGVSASQVDQLLLEGVKLKNSDFTAAAAAVRTDIPRLAPPDGPDFARIVEFGVVPSPGSLIMGLITKTAAEQRQQNQEIRQQQVDAVAQSMTAEADKMRKVAVVQLILSIASGMLTIAGSAMQAGMAGSALGKGLDAGNLQLANTEASGMGQAGGGYSSMLNGASQFIGSKAQAEFKEMEADQEKMRAYGESVKSMDDALKELIQKVLEAQNAVQQAQNQARTRILG
ncbi:hypothetical protein AGMMS49960_07820 [Betaproteobacteria bacterium]|nr:hypothetical protein AGMMS49543_06260 [Betaproteobacteria bacterium]GHU00240.1 hypothetical protein AGMMS49960_07820 [Betaproteobacteria bacterium]GHU23624.1 hypothetical protein AGMMS50243_25360 [Betaproteobacteria bacterium]